MAAAFRPDALSPIRLGPRHVVLSAPFDLRGCRPFQQKRRDPPGFSQGEG